MASVSGMGAAAAMERSLASTCTCTITCTSCNSGINEPKELEEAKIHTGGNFYF